MNLLAGEIVETVTQTTVKLDEGGSAISAVPTQASDMGLKANIGGRPEDMVLTDGDDYLFSDTVTIVEALGEVTQMYFEAPSAEKETNTVIAKLAGIHTDIRGKALRFKADPAKVQIFHNGQSLYYR